MSNIKQADANASQWEGRGVCAEAEKHNLEPDHVHHLLDQSNKPWVDSSSSSYSPSLQDCVSPLGLLHQKALNRREPERYYKARERKRMSLS
jgi:hypothetical protein